MGQLIYSLITSLDGYVADETGNFEWAEPDGEVHSFVNDLYRTIDTHLYGRRLYEVMVWWEDAETLKEAPPFIQDFGDIWRAADKVVYSSTLETVSSNRTRIEGQFEAAAVQELKSSTDGDICIGGPNLAAHAFTAGLIDECHLFVVPVVVGAGTQFLPDDLRLKLELVDVHRFRNGMVYLRYNTRGQREEPGSQ